MFQISTYCASFQHSIATVKHSTVPATASGHTGNSQPPPVKMWGAFDPYQMVKVNNTKFLHGASMFLSMDHAHSDPLDGAHG
eukprot:454153-Amphidinium_carterae.2